MKSFLYFVVCSASLWLGFTGCSTTTTTPPSTTTTTTTHQETISTRSPGYGRGY